MTCEVIKPYEVLKLGNTLGCIHYFFIDAYQVGECIKCGEERRWPVFYDEDWDRGEAMKYAMRPVRA